MGSPWLFASVGVLVVNDHILKAHLPGWWTGKLSDLAGVAVVAVIAAVLMGELRGVVLAGIGFVALKTVPGLAELAAPVLGGVTQRDATDLIALVVLLPVYAAMARSRLHRTRPPTIATDKQRPPHARRAARGAIVLPMLGATLAMFATTATSCGPRPAVTRLVTDDDVVYAEVSRGWASPEWARSQDGGRTWTKAQQAPPGVRTSLNDNDPYEDKPAGPLRACGADGTCFRLRGQRAIEVTKPGGSTAKEFTLTDSQFAAISTGCAGAQSGVLTSVAAPVHGRRAAVASLGADGVVVRSSDGNWLRVGVLGAHPPTPKPPMAILLGPLAFGPILAGTIWLFARKRWPSWRAAIGVALGGWIASVCLASMVGFMLDPDSNFAVEAVLPLGCVATLLAAALIGTSTRFVPRTRIPTGALPPPPGSPAAVAQSEAKRTAKPPRRGRDLW